MRQQRKAGKLSADRVARLEQIGFAWAASTANRSARVAESNKARSAWKNRFDELLAYKRAHGDCDVPDKWNENKKLANWVSQQRHCYKRGTLDVGRVKLLKETG